MNSKLSGAQMVFVPIRKLGENKFPWVENIRSRFIKYIDFYGCQYLPGIADTGLTTTESMFVTIKNAAGNTELIRNLPLARFDYTQTLGIRQPIFSNIALSDCSVNCQNKDAIGTVAAFVFWYDLPEFSKKNDTKHLVTDSVSVPIVTMIGRNQFPDSDRMAGKRFRRIILGTPGKTPDLYDGIGMDQLKNIYVTLRKGSYNVVENIPVMLMYQLAMLEKSEFQNIIFDFQSSFLTVGGNGSIPENEEYLYLGNSVFFNMMYEK